MTIISRRKLNEAWRIYRQNHRLYKEFDFGWSGFGAFIGTRMDILDVWLMDTGQVPDTEISVDVSDLAVAKINALLKSEPKNQYVMLKAAIAATLAESEPDGS